MYYHQFFMNVRESISKNIQETTRPNVKWAVGGDINKAQPHSQFYQKNPEYTVVWANIEDLFKHTSKDFTLDLDDPTGGPNRIKGRIEKAMDHWTNNFMDPSMIAYNEFYKNVSFIDGRHRLHVAHQLGQKYAPVIVAIEHLEDIKKLVRIGTNTA